MKKAAAPHGPLTRHDARFVFRAPAELIALVDEVARAHQQSAAEFGRQALLAALAEAGVTPPPLQRHHKQQQTV